MKGAKRISMTMLGFETLRVIFTNIKTIFANPSTTMNILKNKMNFQLISMVSGYTLIFKVIFSRMIILTHYELNPMRRSDFTMPAKSVS